MELDPIARTAEFFVDFQCDSMEKTDRCVKMHTSEVARQFYRNERDEGVVLVILFTVD